MRFALALLAVMALLVGPVTAAVAQAACSHQASSAVQGMKMASMPGMNDAVVQAPRGQPCCDHSAKHGKTTDLGCAQACATACADAAGLAPSLKTAEFISVQAEVPTPRAAYPHSFEPQGLKRPPKSMG